MNSKIDAAFIQFVATRDNWQKAFYLDEERCLVLRKFPKSTLPWVIHYYRHSEDYYWGGVYTDNAIRALKHFDYVREEWIKDLELKKEHINDLILKLLVEREKLKNTPTSLITDLFEFDICIGTWKAAYEETEMNLIKSRSEIVAVNRK